MIKVTAVKEDDPSFRPIEFTIKIETRRDLELLYAAVGTTSYTVGEELYEWLGKYIKNDRPE
jgi:hypothetical protein